MSVPLYLDGPNQPIFGLLDDPGPERRGSTAVLLCPPFGWEDISSYRSRREWAQRLEAAGIPVLRIDLPGTGDSAGSPRDADRLGAWTRAVDAASAWLRATTGCAILAAAGIGLGGLVACRAAALGAAIDELVLWATPARGRTLVRELHALQRMETARMLAAGAPQPPPLPQGVVEAGGFVLTAETTAALEALDLTALDLGRVRCALLLGRDGLAPDARLRSHLEAWGAAVTAEPGPGYGRMMAGPQDARIPRDTLDRTVTWLAEDGPPSDARPAQVSPDEWIDTLVDRLEALELTVDGIDVRERPLEIDHQGGRLFGVLTEPVDGPTPALCAVLLNSGAIRHVGQNRMWVESARRWAARGVPTLRLDVEGIGDADGDGERYADVTQFYRPALGDQVRAALDALERRGLPGRFVVAGLCAGAYWAFEGARSDPRVLAAFMVNTGALVWDPALVIERDARRMGKLARLSSWRRILRGHVSSSLMRASVRALLLSVVRLPRSLTARRALAAAGGDPLVAALDHLRDDGKHVLLAFCDGEPMAEELSRDGYLERLERWPNVTLERFPGRDHTMRPAWMQCHVHDLLDRALDDALGRLVTPQRVRTGGS